MYVFYQYSFALQMFFCLEFKLFLFHYLVNINYTVFIHLSGAISVNSVPFNRELNGSIIIKEKPILSFK